MPIRCTGSKGLWHGYGTAVWNKLYQAGHISGLRFDEDLLASQDMLFVIKAGTGWAHTEEELYRYQTREGSATQSFNARRMTSLLAWERILEIMPEARPQYAKSLVNLLHNASSHKAYEYIPKLQKLAIKNLRYNMNMRAIAIILFPRSAVPIWNMLKKNMKKVKKPK